MNWQIRLVCATTYLVAVIFGGTAVAAQGSQTNAALADMIASSDYVVRTNGEALLVADRSNAISKLMSALEEDSAKMATSRSGADGAFGLKPSSHMCSIMRALGVLRAEEAVPILLRCLPLKYAEIDCHGLRPRYPNEGLPVLIKIGKPSSKAALERLKTCAERERGLLVEVIKGVEGEAIARFIVRNAISEAKTADEKAALQKAADILGPDTE